MEHNEKKQMFWSASKDIFRLSQEIVSHSMDGQRIRPLNLSEISKVFHGRFLQSWKVLRRVDRLTDKKPLQTSSYKKKSISWAATNKSFNFMPFMKIDSPISAKHPKDSFIKSRKNSILLFKLLFFMKYLINWPSDNFKFRMEEMFNIGRKEKLVSGTEVFKIWATPATSTPSFSAFSWPKNSGL